MMIYTTLDRPSLERSYQSSGRLVIQSCSTTSMVEDPNYHSSPHHDERNADNGSGGEGLVLWQFHWYCFDEWRCLWREKCEGIESCESGSPLAMKGKKSRDGDGWRL